MSAWKVVFEGKYAEILPEDHRALEDIRSIMESWILFEKGKGMTHKEEFILSLPGVWLIIRLVSDSLLVVYKFGRDNDGAGNGSIGYEGSKPPRVSL